MRGRAQGGGHPRGVPLRLDYLRARGRAPTRGAPTVGLFARTGGGHPRGVPLRLDYLRARGGGHPRGVPLRLDYLRARGRAPTRGAHTVGLFARTGGRAPTRGAHTVGLFARTGGRAPTRGAHTVGLFARTGEGTHEGGTYGWIICAHGGGHPRGVPLRLDYLRARGRAPTRGAHTVGLFARTGGRAPTRGAHTVGLFARTGEGTYEGGTYGWIICAHGGGHPRGGHIRLDYLRARGRAPTRGAHTVGLPDVVGDVVFGAEVEDVLFVFVVLFVGVEGVYANSLYGRQIVDFDAFAVERVEAVVDRSLVAIGIFLRPARRRRGPTGRDASFLFC